MAQIDPLRRSHVEHSDAVTTTHSTSSPPQEKVATATLHAAAAAQRRPSRQPEILALQLQRELQRLEGSASDSAEREDAYHLVRAYLLQAHTLAWRGVHQGHLLAPRTIVQALFEVRPFVDRFLPDLDDAQQLAAEIDGTFGAFLAADRVLERLRTEARLADPKVSKSERAVLEVLARVEDDLLLRRNQIYQRLPDPKPTLPRVGQILADLYRDGYLTRQFASARGNALTAHYGLSALGRGLCDKVKIVPWIEHNMRFVSSTDRSVVGPLLEASLGQDADNQLTRAADGTTCAFSLQQPRLGIQLLALLISGPQGVLLSTTSGEADEMEAPVTRLFRQLARSSLVRAVLEQTERRGCFRLGSKTPWPESAEVFLNEPRIRESPPTPTGALPMHENRKPDLAWPLASSDPIPASPALNDMDLFLAATSALSSVPAATELTYLP